ncbi:MAG: hypothetical protein HC821_03610 [Lewinella sp.]|nr:hypothetical protein [Lewinella sp.]
MQQTVKDQLRRLIGSLSKSEKRHFKLYAKRVGGETDRKFVQLFDLIDQQSSEGKLSTMDETSADKALLLRVAQGHAGKLSNLKRHLYQQILVSLRLLYINKQTDIEIRQQIDFGRILYGKGHYLDALRLLDRVKPVAEANNYNLLLQEILEFQKLIEARHFTRSRQLNDKMDELVNQAAQYSEANLHTSLQSNVNIQIQGYYILHGHVREESQAVVFKDFGMPAGPASRLTQRWAVVFLNKSTATKPVCGGTTLV